MPRARQNSNLAARVGRWSAAHWKTATFGWLALVLLQSRSLRVGALAFDAAVKDVVTRLEKVAAVQNVRSPLDPANAGRIAKGGHAALVEFEIRGDSTKAADKLG